MAPAGAGPRQPVGGPGIQSFRPDPTQVRLVVDEGYSGLRDLVSDEALADGEALTDWRGQPTGKRGFALTLQPHSFRVFRAE